MTSVSVIDVRWHPAVFHQVVKQDDYASLHARLPSPRLFDGWEWLTASAEHLPNGRSHLTLVARDGDRLIACLAFTYGSEWRYGLRVRTLRPLAAPYADRSEPVIARDVPGLLERVLAAFDDCPARWDVLYWSDLVSPRDLREHINACLSRERLRWAWRLSSHCPVLSLEGPTPPTPRRSSRRRELQRRRKKLSDLGKPLLQHLQPGPDAIDTLIAEVKEVEDQSWKGAEAVGLLSTPYRRSLFRDLFRRLSHHGVLLYSRAQLDDRLVGYCISFVYRGDCLYYSPGYLPELGRHGIGRLLLADLIAHAHQQGWSCIDASRTSLRARHPLEDWEVAYIDHEELQIYRGTPGGWALHLLEQVVKPPLKQVWHGARTRLHSVRSSGGKREAP